MKKGIYTKNEAPAGVYIFTEKKNCIEPKFWGLYEESEKPVGAIIIGEHPIIVALKGSDNEMKLLDYDVENNNPIIEKDFHNDFNGEAYTEYLAGIGSPAAKFCRDYSCGNIPKGKWYLPSIGEFIVMFENKKRLDIALAVCGGDMIESGFWHWTSTHRSIKSNFIFLWYYGSRDFINQNNNYRVRPVSNIL